MVFNLVSQQVPRPAVPPHHLDRVLDVRVLLDLGLQSRVERESGRADEHAPHGGYAHHGLVGGSTLRWEGQWRRQR